MGWGRHFFLGTFGQQLNIQDQRRALDRHQLDQNWKDRTQDEKIEALEAEIVDLKRYVGHLCQLMIAKGMLPEHEVAKLATGVFEPEE